MANFTGKYLGKYQVLERLGRGGMAEVYKGYHSNLDRHVAIKILHGYLAEGEDFLARFEREARAVANLRHPNIVQIHDFDFQDDHYYMVMEFIDGGTLGDLIKNQDGNIDLSQVLSILTQITYALDYAHGQGLIHRDIKPSNILIDQNFQVYLTDFGIARIASATQFTATGALIGTPAYMSPEQCRGEEINEVSDIYSLGVILYEMLTGLVPYDSETPLSVLQKHISDPIPVLRDEREDLPPEFDKIINKAMAKQASDRYQSASDLLEDLRYAVRQTMADTKEIQPVEQEDETTQKTVVMEEEPSTLDETLEPTVVMEDEELPSPEPVISSPPLDKKFEEETKSPKAETITTKSDQKKTQKDKSIPWKVIIPALVLLAGIIGVLTLSVNCEDAFQCRELAIEQWDSGNLNRAVQYYRKAISYADGPYNEYAAIYCEYTELGWQLDLEDRFKYEAMCFLGEHNITGCISPDRCSEYAYMAWEEGRLWAAAELFLMAADITPEDELRNYAYVWCERAEIYRLLDEPDLAAANEGTCQEWESQ